MSLCRDVPGWINAIPGHLKTQEMCLEAVRIEPCSFAYAPDHFKTEEMCNDAVEKDPYRLGDVPVHYKMARACEKIVEREPGTLMYVPDGLLRLIHGSCIMLLTVQNTRNV